MPLPIYKLKILNNGTAVGEITRATKFKFGYNLNDIAEASFSIPIESDPLKNYEANLITDFSELEVYRNNKLIWSGIDPIIVDQTSGNSMMTQFTFVQKSYLLKNRYFTGTFSNTEESQIAWGLIDATQNDTKVGLFNLGQVGLGFTVGDLQPTQLRDRIYTNDSILKSIQQLTEVINGGDFIFSPSVLRNKKDQFFYGQNIGIDRQDVIFSYSDGSIQSSSRKIDPRSTINYAEGKGNAITSISKFTDDVSISNRKMRQENYNNSDYSIQSTLQETTDGIVETKGNGLTTYDVKLNNTYQFGLFDVGDYVRVKIDSVYTGGRYELDQLMQVLKIQVDVDDKGYEKINITVGDKKAVKKDSFIGYIKNIDNRLAIKEK